ncbi:uncharacterized protein TNCV_3198101 [Trichonephila clavipes]|nr:uncharacterized protein TNCV_3198101 [Trichonephila clavipes]
MALVLQVRSLCLGLLTLPLKKPLLRNLKKNIYPINEDRITKKVFSAQPMGKRRNGRPYFRWIDDLEKDILVLRTRNWRTLAGRRMAWKRLHEKAKAHLGLLGY